MIRWDIPIAQRTGDAKAIQITSSAVVWGVSPAICLPPSVSVGSCVIQIKCHPRGDCTASDGSRDLKPSLIEFCEGVPPPSTDSVAIVSGPVAVYLYGRTFTFPISIWVSVRQLLRELYRARVSNLPAQLCHWQHQLRPQFYPTLPFLPTYVLHSFNYSTHSDFSHWNPPVPYVLHHYTQNRWLAVGCFCPISICI